MDRQSRIYVAGHQGMVGSAIVRKLRSRGFSELILRQRDELDLIDQASVEAFFESERPDVVIMAAAKVGGILANSTSPADFIYQNLIVECNVIHAAFVCGVKRLLFLGSSCIYPRMSGQPIREDALMHGILEPTNESYAIAKIAGIKLCESYNRQYGCDFRSVMPTNLYGPHDNYHLESGHVVPAMIRKFHEAKQNGEPFVSLWGSGGVRREFLHVDDMADASLFVLDLGKDAYDAATEPMLSHLNLGSGKDVTIRELANTIKQVTGFQGDIRWDASKPDGMPRKLLNVDKMKALGWQHTVELEPGLRQTYAWFVEHEASVRK